MGMQLPAESITTSDIPNTSPSGAVGIDLSLQLPEYMMRPDKWLVTAVVTVAPSDLILWGALAAGVALSAADDVWGLHNDKYGAIKAGKLSSALAVGTHHFIVTDIGVYSRLYFQKSAGTVSVTITPLSKSGRSS